MEMFYTSHEPRMHRAFTATGRHLTPTYGTEIELARSLRGIGIDLKDYDGEGVKPLNGGPYSCLTTWVKR